MSVEVSNIARCSSKTNELRDIDPIGCRTRNITYCSVCTAGNVVYMGVPTRVFADAHAQILCCIHRFKFLVSHVVTGLDWVFNLLLKCVG